MILLELQKQITIVFAPNFFKRNYISSVFHQQIVLKAPDLIT